MAHVRFRYLYRDAGNWKELGEVVFSNPHNLSMEEISQVLREQLISSEYFYASKWNIPRLDNEAPYTDVEPWHEFMGLETTSDAPTSPSTIVAWLDGIRDR